MLTDIMVVNWIQRERKKEKRLEDYLKRGLLEGNLSLLHFCGSLLQFSAQYKGATATLWGEDYTLILEERNRRGGTKKDRC